MADEHRIRIRLKAYDHSVVDESARKIAETVIRTQAKIKGPVPLPTRIHRYCVIRGPHVDKTSREHFEIRIRVFQPRDKIIHRFSGGQLANEAFLLLRNRFQ